MIQKLSDSKTLAKVCYYGTKASDENGFFDEKHPDFPEGKIGEFELGDAVMIADEEFVDPEVE